MGNIEGKSQTSQASGAAGLNELGLRDGHEAGSKKPEALMVGEEAVKVGGKSRAGLR